MNPTWNIPSTPIQVRILLVLQSPAFETLDSLKDYHCTVIVEEELIAATLSHQELLDRNRDLTAKSAEGESRVTEETRQLQDELEGKSGEIQRLQDEIKSLRVQNNVRILTA